jgi:hypothetical protein
MINYLSIVKLQLEQSKGEIMINIKFRSVMDRFYLKIKIIEVLALLIAYHSSMNIKIIIVIIYITKI